ncbi:MAG: hypothetical protein LM560_04815 [Desulfurococcaceae archaeon]|jgi:hypothetical protein|nr:hypothetical protein [Desulfurococcaceae archaeon]
MSGLIYYNLGILLSTDIRVKEVIDNLSRDEAITLNYFIRYRSVGELVALKELKALYGVQEPAKVINRLVSKGLIKRGIGCYNISEELIKALKNEKTCLR